MFPVLVQRLEWLRGSKTFFLRKEVTNLFLIYLKSSDLKKKIKLTVK